MKMVKSLLLGTAAGLVAMTGAQAADLPVKAKPVQYVKICSLYGAGFYYIPGTDTCIKIGGWVRVQNGYNYAGNMSTGPLFATDWNDRRTRDYGTRNRGYITADARSQTEYGTLRAYIAVGTSGDNTEGSMNAGASFNRLFIQIGGWTMGRAQSFFDFTNNAALSYNGAAAWYSAGTTTGDPGWQVMAYTAQFGNGLSATLSAEASRVDQIIGPGGCVTIATGNCHEGDKYPDLVGNLRVDQAWGSAQIMGALHDASGTYYGAGPWTGHPSDAMGWAVGGGIKVNLPMLGKGDYFDIQANWGKGASKYTSNGGNLLYVNGAEAGFGVNVSGVYGVGGSVELTETWGVFGGIQHNWDPKWKTSLYGGYAAVEYNANATALVCGAVVGCNPDWSVWHIGSRTAWAPVKDLEVGVDIMYSHLNSATAGTAPALLMISQDQDAWTAHLRVQRNFYP